MNKILLSICFFNADTSQHSCIQCFPAFSATSQYFSASLQYFSALEWNIQYYQASISNDLNRVTLTSLVSHMTEDSECWGYGICPGPMQKVIESANKVSGKINISIWVWVFFWAPAEKQWWLTLVETPLLKSSGSCWEAAVKYSSNTCWKALMQKNIAFSM